MRRSNTKPKLEDIVANMIVTCSSITAGFRIVDGKSKVNAERMCYHIEQTSPEKTTFTEPDGRFVEGPEARSSFYESDCPKNLKLYMIVCRTVARRTSRSTLVAAVV